MPPSSVNVIMPVLGMSQDTGRLVRWLKSAGERVEKGEPLMEVETDKAVVEIEAPASGILAQALAAEGEEVPVAQVVAVIESGAPGPGPAPSGSLPPPSPAVVPQTPQPAPQPAPPAARLAISPVAARIVAEHHLDPALIRPRGKRIEKEDVLAYLAAAAPPTGPAVGAAEGGRVLASPKARRLAAERGLDLAALFRRGAGSGPQGAVLAADVLSASAPAAAAPPATGWLEELPASPRWSRMVERLSAAWPAAPHFYLTREVDATRLVAWRQAELERSSLKVTYTDLLVRLAAVALRQHPRVNALFQDGKIYHSREINIGLAVAVEDGLVVPVIHRADELSVPQLAAARLELVERARAGRLRLEDLQGGTFTLSNLGMYRVDAFCAVLNPPQAAILAVGRIADRVVAVDGLIGVRPTLVITVSFDHRVVDGARGAEFLDALGDYLEDPPPSVTAS